MGHQSHLWGGDHHYYQGAQRGSVLPDMPGDDHQFAASHTGMEAAQLDRVLFSNFEALAGCWGLPGSQRGGVLRPPRLTPDGVLGVVLHLAGHLQRSTHNGRDHLQFEALLALCRL